MKHLGFIKTAACSALLLAAAIPSVRADQWDKKTVMTFSDTVLVPGATLPAGTYVFKLLDSPSDRYIVQIFNQRENHVYATILAIPNYHLTPPDKTLITFYEAPMGQPPPIKAWFYPGDNYGRQFVYKKHEAAFIATATKETVPSEEILGTVETVTEQPATPVVNEEGPVVVVTEPQPEPVVKSEEVTPEPTVADTTTEEINTMPSTGSEWPLIGVIGLSSIAGAFALRGIRRSS